VVSYQDITAAAKRIKGHALVTPLLEVPLLNQQFSGRLLFKAEPLQRTGSFKFRGAFNKLSKLSQIDQLPGVVAYSSGNHAQGVAAAAAHFNTSATIIMPNDAPSIKINNTRALGAKVVLYDRYHESREAIGAAMAEKHGLILVKPYDDEDIIAGQGTLGREIALQCEALNIKPNQAICPCGGGGLISGTAISLQHHFPNLSIWAAEPEHYDDTARSLLAGKRLQNSTCQASICDAIVTPIPGKITFPIQQQRLCGGKVVTDDQVVNAMIAALKYLKLVVEPGGCVGLAAIMAGLLPTENKTTLVILSGGNIDLRRLQQMIAAQSKLTRTDC
jgi:threonine dehydratase